MERARLAFLLLIFAQACHSIEEYHFALWLHLLPARLVSEALSVDPARGFLIANAALVLFGLWCWAIPMRRGWRVARPLAWAWAALESANGVIHILLAGLAGGYFPGLVTAPLLLAGAANLVMRLRGRVSCTAGEAIGPPWPDGSP
jgi:hypothetical protein